MDNETAAFEMTEYLLETGHKKIGFIKGHVSHADTMERYRGFMRAMEKAGLETPSCRTVQGDFTFHSGIEAARLLLSLKDEERPTAIFSSNDDMAAAVYLVAGQMGISVPKDLSVCGLSLIHISEPTRPY